MYAIAALHMGPMLVSCYTRQLLQNSGFIIQPSFPLQDIAASKGGTYTGGILPPGAPSLAATAAASGKPPALKSRAERGMS